MRSVILFIPTLITGGAEKFVVDLAVSIDKEAFDVSVAAVSGVVPEGYPKNRFLSILTDNQIEVYDLKGKNKLDTAIKIWKLLRVKRPDVIHANLSALLYVMIFAAFYSVETRLFTFHNVAGLTESGFIKKLYKIAFVILNFTPVAICDHVKKTIAKEYQIPLGEIPCVYNGVDTEVFSPQIKSYENRSIEFISTGILYHLKNHRLLIDAFAITEASHHNIHLKIIGDGELREELEQQIIGYGLEDKIKILGLMDRVAGLLNQADIFVLSSNQEGLPLSVLEAMACGLPVITTEAGGVVDIVKQGNNGIVTPVGDVEALSGAMIQLIENDQLRKEMGAASRKKALELDLRHCVEKYQELYGGRKPDQWSVNR